MTDRELMQQALEAAPLSDYSKADNDFHKWWYSHMKNDLMQPPLNEVGYRVARYIWDAALRERLAQPEQEPSIRWDASAPVLLNGGRITQYPNGDIGVGTPAPRQWQGLTDAEKVNVAISCGCADVAWVDFADAIEAKLREKNA